MTAQYAFDTLAFVKRLSAAGMETPHAGAGRSARRQRLR
jgi:hypothetical protein